MPKFSSYLRKQPRVQGANQEALHSSHGKIPPLILSTQRCLHKLASLSFMVSQSHCQIVFSWENMHCTIQSPKPHPKSVFSLERNTFLRRSGTGSAVLPNGKNINNNIYLYISIHIYSFSPCTSNHLLNQFLFSYLQFLSNLSARRVRQFYTPVNGELDIFLAGQIQ